MSATTQKATQNQKPNPTPPGAAIAKPPNGTLRDFLHKHRDRIAAMAVAHFREEAMLQRLIDTAALIVHRDPKGNLQKCTYASVLNSLRECARLGLELGGAQAHAYLVPYKDECTLSVSYRGLIALMLRSGEVTSARAHLVWKGDQFDYELGIAPYIKHKPHLGEHAKGEWTHVYAVIHLKNGDPLIDVMTRNEVLMIKGRSKAGESGPWVTDEGEMSRKTVMRRASKYAPMSEQLSEQLGKEDAFEAQVLDRQELPKGNDGLEAALAGAPQLTEPAPKETIETPAAQETVPVTGQPAQEEQLLGKDGKPL